MSNRFSRYTGDVQAYIKTIERDWARPLSGEEQRACLARYRAGDLVGRDELVHSVLRMAVGLSKKFTGRGVPLLDLISVANEAVVRAVDAWDPGKGALTTITHKYVTTALARYVSDQSHEGVYLPIGARIKLRDMDIAEQCRHGADDSGTSTGIAEKLGVSQRYALSLLSMRQFYKRDSSEGLGEVAERDESDGEGPACLAAVEEAMSSGFDPLFAEIISRTIGINAPPEPPAAIAADLGYSVRELHGLRQAAFDALRQAIAPRKRAVRRKRRCRWCMRPLPKNTNASRQFCSLACRRKRRRSRADIPQKIAA